MRRKKKYDPFRTLRKAAIALVFLLFISLGISVFILGSIAEKARKMKEKEENGQTVNGQPKRWSVEDEKEALRLEHRAAEQVRLRNWEKLDALSAEVAGMRENLRLALLYRWQNVTEPKMQIALAGLFRGEIEKTGDANLWNAMYKRLAELAAADKSVFSRRVAYRTMSVFPARNCLFVLLRDYQTEKNDEIRELLFGLLRDRGTAALRGKLLHRFKKTSDPRDCGEVALILIGIQKRHPDSSFEDLKKRTLLPKLQELDKTDVVASALKALGE